MTLIQLIPTAVVGLSLAMPMQTANPPQLQHRGENAAPNPTSMSQQIVSGQITLPPDASGSYEFEKSRESVEISLDENGLSGYITTDSDDTDRKAAPLTFFFDRSSIRGARFSFQTHEVHRMSYQFEGTIVQGTGLTRRDRGYYLLSGTLTTHHLQPDGQDVADKHRVNYKSLGR